MIAPHPIAAYAAHSPESPLSPLTIQRRAVQAEDVCIEIHYCGICHSDLHVCRNDWGNSVYPVVPGHEIVGQVRGVGEQVTGFKIGDWVGVGCFIDACGACDPCTIHKEEQYCTQVCTKTYNSPDPFLGGQTYGGYAKEIVVKQAYVLKISHAPHQRSAVAPLLCAGITLYTPLKRWSVKSGTRVGVIGLGGLGHMGVKLAAAMGAEVVVITHSPHKVADAKRLGAHAVLVFSQEAERERFKGHFDLLLDTIPNPHPLQPYVNLLAPYGTVVLLGAFTEMPTFYGADLILGGRSIAGSLIGGIENTQELLDFCAEKKIVSDVEMIPMQAVNRAYERLLASDVKYRFVIDMASLSACS